MPPPLEDWTPYNRVYPPHLKKYFRVIEGEFVLTELPNGGTRIEGRTWYENEIWPAAYWMGISDFVIHRIHMRVLRHIKNLSETA